MLKSKSFLLLVIFSFFHYLSLRAQVDIPDQNFLQAIINQGVDTNGDGLIQTEEAEATTELDVRESGIDSLSGIEAFINLTYLQADANDLTSVDLSHNTKLIEVNLRSNQISQINLQGLNSLKELQLHMNEFSEIDLSGLVAMEILRLSDNQFSSVDIAHMVNLKDLNLARNNFSSFDLSPFAQLKELDFSNNPITAIDFSNNPLLTNIHLSNTSITELDVKHLRDLLVLVLHNGKYTTLDIGGLDNLFTFWITDSTVETLYMRGCSPDQSQFQVSNSALKYVCADPEYIPIVRQKVDNTGLTDCIVNSFCPYTDEGDLGRIFGKVKVAASLEDCDSTENYLAYPKFYTELLDQNGQHFGTLIGNSKGEFDINYWGTLSLRSNLNNSPFWFVEPSVVTASSLANPTVTQQDFCISPKVDIDFARVDIIPLDKFKAGFETECILSIKNRGSNAFSGTFKLSLPADSVSYVNADIEPVSIDNEMINWDLPEILPLKEFKIKLTLRTNSPMDSPAIFGGETISLCAELNTESIDQQIDCFEDTIVNSFDPNDKTYTRKDTVSLEVLEELQYLIRFENTGSAAAQHVVITDTLDNFKMNIELLRVLDASHEVQLEMGENDVATFIFQDIQLSHEEGMNTGYVLFGVYPRKNNLENQDEIYNRAAIFFDYNPAIVTNQATTWIRSSVNTIDLTTSSADQTFTVYPNPSNGVITIQSTDESQSIESISLYNNNGQIILQQAVNDGSFTLDCSNLSEGVFHLGILSNNRIRTKKIFINKQ